MKLLVSEYDVTVLNEKTNSEFVVKLKGPINSIYEGVLFCQVLRWIVGYLVCESIAARLVSLQITFNRFYQ